MTSLINNWKKVISPITLAIVIPSISKYSPEWVKDFFSYIHADYSFEIHIVAFAFVIVGCIIGGVAIQDIITDRAKTLKKDFPIGCKVWCKGFHKDSFGFVKGYNHGNIVVDIYSAIAQETPFKNMRFSPKLVTRK